MITGLKKSKWMVFSILFLTIPSAFSSRDSDIHFIGVFRPQNVQEEPKRKKRKPSGVVVRHFLDPNKAPVLLDPVASANSDSEQSGVENIPAAEVGDISETPKKLSFKKDSPDLGDISKIVEGVFPERRMPLLEGVSGDLGKEASVGRGTPSVGDDFSGNLTVVSAEDKVPILRERVAPKNSITLPTEEEPLPIGDIAGIQGENLLFQGRPPAVGDIPDDLGQNPGSSYPKGGTPGKMIETGLQTVGLKELSLREEIRSMDTLIFSSGQNFEIQDIIQRLVQAVESEDSMGFRILIKHILELHSPAEVLFVLHTIQESTGNNLIHLLANARSRELVYELKTLAEAFMPFDRKNSSLDGLGGDIIPLEFREVALMERDRTNLWELDVPVDLEGTEFVQAVKKEDLMLYYKARNTELLKPGNTKYLLALFYGNTRSSIYDFFEGIQINKETFAGEKEDLFKWFTLPLYRRNKTGLTPLQIAQRVSEKTRQSGAFGILSRAETILGIDTSQASRGGKRSGKTVLTTIKERCLRPFQK